MPLIYLVRHGETAWNREHRWQGQRDVPLTALGEAQARAAGRRLAHLDPRPTTLYASPLIRAWRTAELIGEACRLEPIVVPAMQEVDVGSWEGLTRPEVEARFPQQLARWLDYDQGWQDGESYDEMGQRVVSALLGLAAAHLGEQILAVTHGGPIRAAFAYADGTSHADARRLGPRISNAFVAKFAVEDEALRRLD